MAEINLSGDPWSAFASFGGLGLMLWWLTQKLIPQMQRQLDAVIHEFKDQIARERLSHEAMTNRWVLAHEQAVQGMLRHMQEDHVRPPK